MLCCLHDLLHTPTAWNHMTSNLVRSLCVDDRLSLVALDVQNNRLSTLPPQLGGMTGLRSFLIGGNPLKGFKPTLLQAPARDVLAALRHRMAEVGPLFGKR